MKKQYVVGFLFSGPYVALIEKKHPEWQAGKLNGIGGKIEPGELPLDAMKREFMEETGLRVDDWRFFVLMEGTSCQIYCFTSRVKEGRLLELQALTDEVPDWYEAFDPETGVLDRLPNLSWLIPLALCQDTDFAMVTFKT